MIKIILCTITSLFILSNNAYSSKISEKVSLQLKWKYQFQFAGFIIAKEKGFYENVGLNVELKEYKKNTSIIKDVLSNESTFGIYDSSLILETLKGKPLLAVMAILQESPNILMGLKSSNIKTLEDLNNKKLALYENLNAMTVVSMLQSNHVKYKSSNVIFDLDKLISKEVDMSSAYITNEPFVAREKGLEIITFNPKDYGFDSYGDILFTSQDRLKDDPELVHNFYNASKKGWEYAFNNIEETVNIIYNKYNTLQKSKKALTYEAHELKKLSGTENNFGNLDKNKIKSIALLLTFMINDKYDLRNLNNFIYKIDNKKIYLTKEEQEYLQNQDKINMCYNTSVTPYTMLEKGNPVGVSVDYLRLVEKKINKKFNFIYVDTIQKQFEMLYNKKCTTVPVIQTSPQAVPFVTSTVAAGKDNIVLVTKIDEPYIFNMEILNTKKIGIHKDYVHLSSYLDENHPMIKYIKIEGNGLEKVENGELFGVIGTSIEMNYDLNENYKNSLKIMAEYPDSYIEGGIGVHTDELILLSILNKAVSSLEPVKRKDVFDKWINVKYKTIIDYTLVWEIIFVAAILILIFLFWNKRLNKEIIKRKKAEQVLQYITDAHIDFMNDLPIGIISQDLVSKEESYYNKKFYDMFGWDLEEINTYDKWFMNAYPDENYRIQVMKIWEEKRKEAKRKNSSYSSPIEVNITCKDGTTKWCQVNYYEKKEFLNAGIFVDISELKKVEKNLFDLNANLEKRVNTEVSKSREKDIMLQQQYKMASMGEMIENIAHQWRQPLAQINSTILLTHAILDKNNMHNSNLEEKFLEIEALTDYMSKTINDFQNFLNPNKNKETFFLYEALEKSLFIIKGSLDSHYIEIITDVDKTLKAQLYRNELEQVFVILIHNAIDALVNRKIENPKIFINIYKNDTHFILEVADNAKGIDTEIIKKVFDPYFTTKHKTQGTGLGLYMATKIVENGFNSKISAENTKSGVCFKILLKNER